jgi:hypothetical protein
MGLFSTMVGKGTGAKVGGGGRLDLGNGTYLLKVEKIETPPKRGTTDEYLKAHFTVIKVLDDAQGRAQPVKSQPTHAIFPPKSVAAAKFYEEDMRQLLQGLMGLTNDEINSLPFGPPPADKKEAAIFKIEFEDYEPGNSVAELLEAGVKNGSFQGVVMQARAHVRPNAKDPSKGFQKVHFTHVPAEKVQAALTPEAFEEFFPQAAGK